MVRVTVRKPLLVGTPGTERYLLVHKFGSDNESCGRVYIQASLHADEVPGMLVANHLIKMLDVADSKGEIRKEIVIVPYANPIGLSQFLFGKHMGRYCLESGINFNRDWKNFTDEVWNQAKDKLTDDANANVMKIREIISDVIRNVKPETEEASLKHALLEEAAISDVVMDLHCDSDAVMHMYTHDRLWPALQDLASELGSRCQLLDSDSGGVCFDEAVMNPWANFQDKAALLEQAPPIPMACQACTVELRGQHDVSDELAEQDAHALFRFLIRRGYIKESTPLHETPSLLRPPTPLTGVDMIKAKGTGVLVWKCEAGDNVDAGQVLGEIVDVADVDAPRIPITSQVSGVVFGRQNQRMAKLGDIVIKVAGKDPLPWRVGKLLTD